MTSPERFPVSGHLRKVVVVVRSKSHCLTSQVKCGRSFGTNPGIMHASSPQRSAVVAIHCVQFQRRALDPLLRRQRPRSNSEARRGPTPDSLMRLTAK
jgi:hypothetical protein